MFLLQIAKFSIFNLHFDPSEMCSSYHPSLDPKGSGAEFILLGLAAGTPPPTPPAALAGGKWPTPPHTLTSHRAYSILLLKRFSFSS